MTPVFQSYKVKPESFTTHYYRDDDDGSVKPIEVFMTNFVTKERPCGPAWVEPGDGSPRYVTPSMDHYADPKVRFNGHRLYLTQAEAKNA